MATEKERNSGSASAEISKYLDILARDPNSRVFAPLAEAYRKAGLLDDAVETALEGLKAHPNYLGGRVALGRAYFEKKRFAEAAAEMQKVATAAPDNIIAHRVLGQIADSRGDLPAAEKSFKMVLLLDPRDLEAQQFLKALAGKVAPAAAAPVAKVTPAATVTPPSAPPPVTQRAQPVQPVQPPPPPTPPILFDEIQAIEDVELEVDEPLDIGPELRLPPPEPPKIPVAAPEPPLPAPGLPFGEIDLGSVVHAPAQDEPEAATDSLIEVFTRVRGTTAAPPPAKVERGGKTGAREVEVETTAYNPADTFSAADVPLPLLSLDEELPRIDLAQELDFGSQDDVAPVPAALAAQQEVELAPAAWPPAAEIEIKSGAAPEPEFEPELEPELEIANAPAMDQEFTLETDLDLEPVQEPEEESPASSPAAGRGVFDTETLASIYINQGFYRRAAEIYQRLVAQRPDDAGLRDKLEEVLARERGQAAAAVPAAGPAAPAEVDEDLFESFEAPAEPVEDLFESFDEQAETVEERVIAFAEPEPELELEPVAAGPAAAVRPGPEMVISQLQTLLEAFKGGRPR